MCPLRVILIFLSATLAGFFVLRKNFKSSSQDNNNNNNNNNNNIILECDSADHTSSIQPNSTSNKVRGAINTGFWTCIDMASGRYLWRNLISSSSSSSSSKCPT